MSPSLGCMKKCVTPCATCSEDDPSTCLSCIAGYIFDTEATQNCRGDLDCSSSGTCQRCPVGFSMNRAGFNTSCSECGNCARCNPNRPNDCISCRVGSYLSGL